MKLTFKLCMKMIAIAVIECECRDAARQFASYM